MTTLSKLALKAAAFSFIVAAYAVPASADNADKALGTWLRAKQNWHVQFAMCDDDASKLCGTVISGEGVDKKTQGPVVGVRMLFDLVKTEDGSKWKGRMYDPKGGGMYKGSVKILKDGRVKMSGCMAPLLCKSEKWTRVIETTPVVEAPVADETVATDGTE